MLFVTMPRNSWCKNEKPLQESAHEDSQKEYTAFVICEKNEWSQVIEKKPNQDLNKSVRNSASVSLYFDWIEAL